MDYSDLETTWKRTPIGKLVFLNSGDKIAYEIPCGISRRLNSYAVSLAGAANRDCRLLLPLIHHSLEDSPRRVKSKAYKRAGVVRFQRSRPTLTFYPLRALLLLNW